MRTIRCAQDVLEGAQALAGLDPRLQPVIEAVGEIPLRLSTPDFAGLASIIVSQQVSKASADAIFGRLRQLVDPLDAATVLASPEPVFRKAGLSRPKQRALLAAAEAVHERRVDLLSLCELPPDQAIGEMTRVKGIGPWTAEIYLLFCAGHGDIMPAGDLALQEAARSVLGLESRPNDRQLREIAARWSPWRGVAARLLWAHYALSRGGREGAPV